MHRTKCLRNHEKEMVSFLWDPISTFLAKKANRITSFIPPPPNADKKKVLMVIAHPSPKSFLTSLARTAERSLVEANHEVKLISLYEEKFQPVLTEKEFMNYMGTRSREADVTESAEALQWCDSLILCYPTWWYGPPAILKGWMDRVFLPGIAFDVAIAPEEKKLASPLTGLIPKLDNIKHMGVITTLGADFLRVRAVGDTGRQVMARGVRPLFHRHCTLNYLCLYSADAAPPAKREAFLARVAETFRYF
mmetsp:Transcript_30642/g.48200  ORF Transcript_30642/g.48200 Transcript_30642/m.48200 type:complete len:250 (-) Transcript_30642:356-1105(-)